MPDKTRPAERSGTFAIGGDLPVHRLGFGAMRITGKGIWGPPEDHDEAIRVLRRTLELGINLIDTADSYGPDVSEQLIAEALYPYPQGLLIATKAGLTRPGPDEWRENGRPEHLRNRVESSLKRLRLERIDLLQLHRIDPKVPLEDQIGTLVRLQQEGKIRHIGLSNVNHDQLHRAQALTPIVSIQNRYNPGDRSSEALVDLCAQEHVAFLPWAPVQNLDQIPTLARIAEQHGATAYQVALAWLLARSETMLPIPGTGSVQHLEENVAAAGLRLDPQQIAALNDVD